LAIQPSEEVPASRNGEKAARQEAAVKNIPQRPPAPEPHAEDAAASPGLVSRFTHWLSGLMGGTHQEEPEAAPAPVAPVRESRARGERSERNGRNGERNERGGERSERGGERRNNRSQRGERSERDNARVEKSALSSAQDKAPRSPRSQGEQRGNERQERQERQERPDAAQPRANGDNGKSGGNRRRGNRDKAAVEESSLAQQTPVVEAVVVPRAPDEQAALVDTPEKRRRRSRGGRRSRSSEGGVTEASDLAAVDALDEGDDLPLTAGLPFDAPSTAQSVFPDELPVVVNESFVPEESAPVARKEREESAEPAPVPMPLLKETDSFSAAPAFIPETPAPAAEPAPAPLRNPEPPAVPARTADLFGSLEEAGLVMIETSSEKPHFSAGTVEEPVRRGRKPRPAPLVVEEPLQQVETHRED
jgi:ribonuclease E